jgi:U6 snRNA-associated Sm-like protein LSm8
MFLNFSGFDQLINLILDDTHERIFSTTAGMEQIALGLKIIRGDNVSVIGLVDEAVEQSVDFSKMRGEPLNPVVH